MVKYLFRETWAVFQRSKGRILVNNLFFVLSLGLMFLFPFALKGRPVTFILGFLIGLYILHLCIGGVSHFTAALSSDALHPLGRFFHGLKSINSAAIVLTIISLIQFTLLYFGLPFYLSLSGFAATIALSLIFWASIGWQLASQYYYSGVIQLEYKPGKSLSKCFVFLVDNFLFTIFLGLSTLLLMVVSAATLFIFPGMGFIALYHQTAFKQRMRKYDYLDEHPGLSNKKAIPWDKLLETSDSSD